MIKNKKKRFSLTMLLAVILIAGLTLLLYPTVSNWWNSFHATHQISEYEEELCNLTDEEYEKLLADARAYNERLAKDGGRWTPNEEEEAEYYSLLDPTGTGIMGSVEIPVLQVKLPVFHGTNEATLQTSVGHLLGSSLPVGGEGTHAVFSGHRGLPSAKLFTNLDEMVEGDIFILNILNDQYTYQVDQIRTVLPDEIEDLEIEEGQDYCTLITCTPYGINSHRLLVRGHRVDNDPSALDISPDATQISVYRVALCIGVVTDVILFILVMVTNRRKVLKGGSEFEHEE